MKEQLQAIITVLSLVNPAICAAMFSEIEAGRSRGVALADATKVGGAVCATLALSAAIAAAVRGEHSILWLSVLQPIRQA
jgi:multiple antibiotic resistance protein